MGAITSILKRKERNRKVKITNFYEHLSLFESMMASNTHMTPENMYTLDAMRATIHIISTWKDADYLDHLGDFHYRLVRRVKERLDSMKPRITVAPVSINVLNVDPGETGIIYPDDVYLQILYQGYSYEFRRSKILESKLPESEIAVFDVIEPRLLETPPQICVVCERAGAITHVLVPDVKSQKREFVSDGSILNLIVEFRSNEPCAFFVGVSVLFTIAYVHNKKRWLNFTAPLTPGGATGGRQ